MVIKVKKKKEMKKKNLTRYYLLLIILTLILVILIILFTKLTHSKPGLSEEISSLSLWRPFEDISKQMNRSANESLIEKNKQIETPSNMKLIKATFEQYWFSYIFLFLIVVLFTAWVIIILKIYNG